LRILDGSRRSSELISCILTTARSDHPIIGLPKVHLFEPTFTSLEAQTFRDFELIIVDALYPSKRDWIEARDWSFPVKYVPPHPNHRFWLDRHRWNVCGMLNTGILYVDGELICRIDDCSEFGPGYLQRVWDEYERGYWLQAMHIRYLEGKPARVNKEYLEKGYEAKYYDIAHTLETETREALLLRIYGEEGLVRDTRYPVVKAKGGRMVAPAEWFYGYSSLSLEAALRVIRVNGFNELFDGDKGQEDQEMGLRLSMAGYDSLFLLDVGHQVIEHEHLPIPEPVISHDQGNIKCNYAIYLLNQRKGRWRANAERLTDDELEFIREESLRPPCSPKPHFYLDECRGDLFRLWADNQPLFDLREERLAT